MVTLLLNLEQRSRSKRNKWRGPPSAAREGSSPFMPDCFLSVAEGSADRLRLPHSSNDTNRLAILDSDGPEISTDHTKASFVSYESIHKDSVRFWRPELSHPGSSHWFDCRNPQTSTCG